MTKDSRLYGKFTLGFPNHPKICILSDAAFRCLVEVTLWSREQETDGFLARRLALAKWSLDALQELCQNDDANSSLVEREEGWYIHDFAEHQDTKADIDARRERNRAAGQKGGLARAKRRAKPPAKRKASESLSENVAETESEAENMGGGGQLDDEPRCERHRNDPHPPPCHDCRRVREHRETRQRNGSDPQTVERIARRQVIEDCALCDDRGLVEIDEEGTVARCDHQLAAL
jgi:hypothetical protein